MFIKFYTSVANCVYFIIVISQPDDVTILKGYEAMFTCALKLTDGNTRYTDLEWYRFTKSTNTIERMDPYEERINFVIRTTGNTTSSSLNITNAIASYNGYYWVGTPSFNVCNVSLTVKVLTGMYVHNKKLYVNNVAMHNDQNYQVTIFLILPYLVAFFHVHLLSHMAILKIKLHIGCIRTWLITIVPTYNIQVAIM